MIYTARAALQIDALRCHYEALGRIEAIQNLRAALADAEEVIERDPSIGLPAPRPYPRLVRNGRAWIKSGRYWIAFTTARPRAIVAVVYEAANIPSRI